MRTNLESLLRPCESFRPSLSLADVLAADNIRLQQVLLVEVRLLEIFLKAGTEIAADLALQVSGHPFTLELDHPELL